MDDTAGPDTSLLTSLDWSFFDDRADDN